MSDTNKAILCAGVFLLIVTGIILIAVHEYQATQRTAMEQGYQEVQNVGVTGTHWEKK